MEQTVIGLTEVELGRGTFDPSDPTCAWAFDGTTRLLVGSWVRIASARRPFRAASVRRRADSSASVAVDERTRIVVPGELLPCNALVLRSDGRIDSTDDDIDDIDDDVPTDEAASSSNDSYLRVLEAWGGTRTRTRDASIPELVDTASVSPWASSQVVAADDVESS